MNEIFPALFVDQCLVCFQRVAQQVQAYQCPNIDGEPCEHLPDNLCILIFRPLGVRAICYTLEMLPVRLKVT